jgi:hypothetical protein
MAPGRMRNCRSTSAAASTLMAGELACLFGVSARHEVVCKLTICPEPRDGDIEGGGTRTRCKTNARTVSNKFRFVNKTDYTKFSSRQQFPYQIDRLNRPVFLEPSRFLKTAGVTKQEGVGERKTIRPHSASAQLNSNLDPPRLLSNPACLPPLSRRPVFLLPHTAIPEQTRAQ